MGVPTIEESAQAKAKAIEMREHGQDPDHLAKCYLHAQYRLGKAETIVKAVRQYLHSGQSSTEHTRLLQLIRKYESSENDDVNFGLE